MSDRTSEPVLTLRLKRREARRIQAGHPWVFANEVESVAPDGQAAGLCRVFDDSKRFVGTAYYNRHSLICARLLTRDPDEAVDPAFFAARFDAAARRRATLYPDGEAFRWVFGEADGLPGLVVDSYPAVVVAQVSTLGMQDLQPLWEPALRDRLAGRPLVLRNDSPGRSREGLPLFVACPDGPVEEPVVFTEAGTPVAALPRSGQKTGFYLDQRENRIWARRLAGGADVLDLYAYTGAWGLHLLAAGAARVTLVDESEHALTAALTAAGHAGRATQCRVERASVPAYLRALQDDGQRFDLVVADPPALIPTRKAWGAGRRSYLSLFRAVLEVVAPGGHAILSSCSYHLSDNDFGDLLAEASGRARRGVQCLWRGGAGPDHPRPVTFPEAHYLKCAFVTVL